MPAAGFLNDISSAILPAALERVRTVYPTFGLLFPSVGDGRNRYLLTENRDWLASFSVGLRWLTYAATGDPDICAEAKALLPTFVERLERRIHLNHDLGFLFLLSARAQWQLTGDQAAHQQAMRAAQELAGRYRPLGGYLQAWGEIGDDAEGGRFIVDCMMNIPLLFWAARETGQQLYYDIAVQHAITSQRHLVRDDGSTYHTFFFDPSTGQPMGPRTHQGYADDSLWARGQSWAIYGFALAAEWTGRNDFLDTARRTADRFLAEHPSNGVSLWDLRLPADAPQYPDSSADAIAIGGMFRIARLATGDESSRYRNRALNMLERLIKDCFETDVNAQGLLKHGTYHAHQALGVDTYTIFGDYFFLEALLQATGQAPDFWGPASR